MRRALAACWAIASAATAQAAPTATLAVVAATQGSSPLATTFDVSGSQLDAGQTAPLHLVFPGNGDALLVTGSTPLSYTYALPGFYLAGSWLTESPSGQFAAATPVGLSVARVSDGQAPPAVDVVVAPVANAPLARAFMPVVTAAAGDPEVARRWDFGDGSFSGEPAPEHAYARAGLYQATLWSTSRAGLPAMARLLVPVAAADGSLPPSLLVGITPPDSPPLTQLQLVAYVAASAAPTVVDARVDWPGLSDVSPAVTTEATGVVVRSSYALPTAGVYDVPITVDLAGQPPLTATGRVTVGNLGITVVAPPSPALLVAPSSSATVGQPYEPNGAGAKLHALLVSGSGPFAFAVVAPSPAGFIIDGAGNVKWTPTATEVGDQRIAVTITDTNSQTLSLAWVVTVTHAHGSGCAATPGAATTSETTTLLLLALLAVAIRRLRRQ